MRKIVYPLPDGRLAVVTPVINTMGEAEGFTEADAEQRAWDRLPKDAVAPHWIDASEIPADRTFRNAWKADGKTIAHDMAKVREIAHTRRRKARDFEMAPHDDVIAKKVPGSDADAAERERAKIRGKYSKVQAAIDAAVSVDEIKTALDVK